MKKVILIQFLQLAAVLLVFFLKYEPEHAANASLAAMFTGVLSSIVFVRLYLEISYNWAAITGFSLTSVLCILTFMHVTDSSKGMIAGTILLELVIIVLFQLVAEDLYPKAIDWKKRSVALLVPIIGGVLIWCGMTLITKIPQ